MSVTGFVDQTTAYSVNGWIVNTEQPDVLEEIWVLGENGRKAVFYPLVFRSDVCKHFGFDGTFGFSIPLYIINQFGGSISIRSRYGNPLEGGTSIPIPPTSIDMIYGSTLKRLFIHIQKCSGTSLRNSLIANLSGDQVLFVYPDNNTGVAEYKLQNIRKEQLRSFEIFFGHFKFGFDRLLDNPFTYITILRDPIERLRSQFWHAHRLWKRKLITDKPAQFVVNRNSEEFDNLMTRCVAGLSIHDVGFGCIDKSCVELAINNINKNFSYVGLLESIKNSVDTLSSALNVKLEYLTHDNLAGAKSSEDIRDSLSVDWPSLIDRNKWDILLYSRVIDEGLSQLRKPSG